MKKIKQFIVFLLIVISIYATLLFYLLMSVHADSRLQEIDYLEKNKFDKQEKVLFMDRIVSLNDRMHHFALSRLSYRIPKPVSCKTNMHEKALLIVAASSFDPVTIFIKLMRQLQIGSSQCDLPQVFVLKRLRPLILTSQQNFDKYSMEIGEIIKYLTIQAEYQISIFSYEEGALMTLAYFARKNISTLFTNIVQRVKTLLFIDIVHPFIRIEYDPPYKLFKQLKKEICSQKQRVKIFNRLKMVMISTHKQDNNLESIQFVYGKEMLVFSKTVLISSREMANVHYYLPPNSLSFPPFVRRLGHFISKDFAEDMEVKEIASFLRNGQSYPYEKINYQNVSNCHEQDLTKNSFIITKMHCLKINSIMLKDNQVLLVYAPNHFEMFAYNYQKIYPFDNLTEGSIFLFEKLENTVYVMNNDANIHIKKQLITHPASPLSISEQDLNMSSQLIFSNYSVLRVCPDILLTFPLHFAQGNIQRGFLGQGSGNCFLQISILQQFSSLLFVHWSFFRNLIIFSLICSQFLHRSISERLFQQFLINLLFLMGQSQINRKILLSIYILSLSLLIECGISVIVKLCSYLNFKKEWKSFVLLIISTLCLVGSAFSIFNYWRIFLLSVIFFISKQNITLFLLKLYFLKDEILYNGNNVYGFSDIGLLMMWLYTSLILDLKDSQSEIIIFVEKQCVGCLIIILAFSLGSSGSFIHTILTIYMILIVVLRILKIMRK